jgi:hypothetical protein
MDRLRFTALGFLLAVASSVIVPLRANSAAQDSPDKNNPSLRTTATDAAREAESAPPVAPAIPPNARQICKQTRYEIIRDFETQMVYARAVFPMGTKGLELHNGVTSPNGEELQQTLNLWGPSIRPGDPVHISYVSIKSDHIHFDLNGGPVHRQKWYEHVQVSGGNGPLTTGPDSPQTNAHGSYLDVYFDKYVPEMTPAQLRNLLLPVLDFNARNKEQAYLDTLPPKVKHAVQAHHVLVGMNQDMVLHAKGKPPKKVREHDGETMFEEWIYGEPPADVDFVRFVGEEVVRVETVKVDGEKLVRTEKEVFLEADKNKEAKTEQPEQRPAHAPSLRRPGEDSEDVPKPANGAAPPPPMPPPDLPQPGGPGQMVGTM